MRKFALFLVASIVIAATVSSCTATKRDCQGVRHTKQKGGFYL